MFDRHDLEVTGSLCMILTLFEGCLGVVSRSGERSRFKMTGIKKQRANAWNLKHSF